MGPIIFVNSMIFQIIVIGEKLGKILLCVARRETSKWSENRKKKNAVVVMRASRIAHLSVVVRPANSQHLSSDFSRQEANENLSEESFLLTYLEAATTLKV